MKPDRHSDSGNSGGAEHGCGCGDPAATYTSNVLLRAVNEALTMAGGNASMLANNGLEEDTTVPEDTQTQLVVIGGRCGGMTTALHAAELGVDVTCWKKWTCSAAPA